MCLPLLGHWPPDLPSLLVYPVDYWLFITPSTDLLGGRTFLLVLKKLNFWYLKFFSDFYLFFVWIHCLVIGLRQPVTKYLCYLILKVLVFLIDYFDVCNTGMHVYLSPHRASSHVLVVIFLSCA